MALFGFIGAGNMGYPLIKAAIQTFGSNEVVYTDASLDRCRYIMEQTKVAYLENNHEVVEQSKYLVLAIKPQFMASVLEEIQKDITKEHIVISIAAGITINSIKEFLGSATPVVRVMPNTPAMVNQGMSAVCYSEHSFQDSAKETVDSFLSSFGKYVVLNENLMNAAICANGSSPAYVYMFIEALADSVVSYGIPRDKAYLMAAQTVIGAASMILETGEHPGKLKDEVCSPGGTTIAAVKALEEHGFRNAIMKASDACYEKAASLSLRK